MNKKFLTALLLGAFTIASTSTLVSCKDYDDDINGLQEQIDGNGQDIAALQSALNKAKTDLQADITKLEGELAAEKARAEAAEKKVTDGLADEIARAKDAEGKINSTLTTEISNEIARAKAEEGKLSELISAEVTRATAAEATLEAKIKTANEAIDAIDKALATKADKATFEAFVAEVNAKLKVLGDDLTKAQTTLQKAIDDEATRAKKAEEDILGKVTEEANLRATAIKAEKDARETAIAALELKDKTLEAFDEKIQTRVDNIEKAYKAADEQLGKDIEAAKKALQGEIATAKSEVLAELTTQVAALNASLSTQKKELEDKITALDTKLSKALQDEKEAREAAEKKEAADRVAAIQDLQGQLDAQVISIQNMVQNLSTKLTSEVTRLEGLIAKAQKAAGDAAEAATTAGLYAQQAKDDLQSYIESSKEALAKAKTALQQDDDDPYLKKSEIDELLKEYAKRVDVVNNRKVIELIVEAFGGKLTNLPAISEVDESQVKQAVMQAVYAAVVQKVNISDIKLALPTAGNALRSLVAEPKFYYHGIQAFDASRFEYFAKKVKEATVTAPNEDWYDDKATETATTATSFIPDLTLVYHLNPSTATINTDNASLYKFAVLNREYTRAVNSDKIVPVAYKVTRNNGKITVKARVAKADKIQNIAADDAVTVLALQYHATDTVITSDYTALKAYKYDNVVLNNVVKQAEYNEHVHLYTTAMEACDEAFNAPKTKVVKIKWDSDGMDLFEMVNTHRDIINGTTSSLDVAWDSKASAEELKEYGLKYSFQLIGWKKGTNNTSESVHAQLYQDGKKLWIVPQAPTRDGKVQTATDKTAAKELQNRGAEIGREPLVRVLLTDTVNNKVVALGYIKFHIDDKDEPAPNDEYRTYTYENWDDKAFTVKCNGNALEAELYWNEIEHDVLSNLNLSAEEFRGDYEYEGSSNVFIEYTDNTKNATAITTDNGIEVRQKLDQIIAGTTTDVISWTVSNLAAWQNIKKVGDQIVVYVRYKKKNTFVGNEAKYQAAPAYLVFKLIWKPNQVNRDPQTALDITKIPQYWYGPYDTNPNSGSNAFDNIHGNVETVGTNVPMYDKASPEANDEFVFDIKSALQGNKISVASITGYPEISNFAGNEYSIQFAPILDSDPHSKTAKGIYVTASGSTEEREYALGVNNGKGDGYSYLTAKYKNETPVDIARMVMKGANMGVVTYLGNDVAKALLNYRGRMQQNKGQTLTAKVEVVFTTCAPVTSVPVSNNSFFVKFLRPISAENGSAEFEDAVTNGSVSPISMTFRDWRNHEFTNTAVTLGRNYFEYYGVWKDGDNVFDHLSVPVELEAGAPKVYNDEDGRLYYKLNPKMITTTLGTGSKLGDPDEYGIETTKNGTFLNTITSDLVLSWYPPTKVGVKETRTIKGRSNIRDNGFGVLVYENNGANVGAFKLRIPVYVTYHWGTVVTYVNADVKETTWAPVKRK